MTDEIAGKIVDAYKASPLLTGLLLLNVAVIIGFGWWEHRRVNAVDAEGNVTVTTMANLAAGNADVEWIDPAMVDNPRRIFAGGMSYWTLIVEGE